MTTLILHPGAPKTATTTLQQILRENRNLLSRAGIGLILPEDLRGKPYLGRYLSAYRGGDIPDINQQTADFFGPFLARFKHVICSEETFCHDHMPSRKFGFGGIDRSETAAELLSHSGATDTRVVLSIRPQIDFLISTYTHFVHRHREVRDFPSWLNDQVFLPKIVWQPAVGAFRDRFGTEAVDVISLAMVREVGMEGYLLAMLDAFGIGHLNLPIATDEICNPSPSRRAVHLSRMMNHEITNERRSETINTALVNTFPVKEFGKFSPQGWSLPDEIAQHFAVDHSSVVEPR